MNEILTRERPYQKLLNQGISCEVIFQRICEENLRVTMTAAAEDEYAEKINMIIHDCLQSDPNSRPSCLAIKVSRIANFTCHSLILDFCRTK